MEAKLPKKTKTVNLEASRKAKKVVFPKVRMFGMQIMTTAHQHTVTNSGVILQDNKGNIITKQVVVAAGPNSSAKVGETVEVDPNRFPKTYSKPKHDVGPDIATIQVPIEEIDGVTYLFMSTNELKYVYTDVDIIPNPDALPETK